MQRLRLGCVVPTLGRVHEDAINFCLGQLRARHLQPARAIRVARLAGVCTAIARTALFAKAQLAEKRSPLTRVARALHAKLKLHAVSIVVTSYLPLLLSLLVNLVHAKASLPVIQWQQVQLSAGLIVSAKVDLCELQCSPLRLHAAHRGTRNVKARVVAIDLLNIVFALLYGFVGLAHDAVAQQRRWLPKIVQRTSRAKRRKTQLREPGLLQAASTNRTV